MESAERADYATRFKGAGVGTKYKQPSITVRFPEQADQVLRSLPNMSDYVRRAVLKQLVEDRLLGENFQPVNPD